jgi:hypothetical protein
MMDEDTEISGDDSTKDILEIITDNENAIAFGLDSKMRTYQIHYTVIKTRYKRLAFTWLIATFIGLGYFLRGAEVNIHLNNYVVITVLLLLSSVGILLLYFLDIGIYQRINEAIFVESLKLEKKYPFLGTTGNNVFKLLVEKKLHPIIYEGLLYAAFTSVLLLLANISFSFFLKDYSLIAAIISFIIFSIFICFFEVCLISATSFSAITTLFKHHFRKD